MRRLKRAGSIIRPECSRASTGPPTRPAFNDRRAAFAVKWLFAPHFKCRMWLCHRPLAGKKPRYHPDQCDKNFCEHQNQSEAH